MAATGRYYRITPRFWQDSDVRNEWTEDMRILALYLLTSPHRNMVGLYYCPINYMESDLQWTSERLQSAFEALCADSVDFIRYDRKAQVVFVVNGLKHDAPSTGNQIKGADRVLQGIPNTYLLDDLLNSAKTLCPGLVHALQSAIEAQLKSLRSAIEVPSNTVPRTPYPDTVSASASVPPEIGEDEDVSASPAVPYQAIVSAYHLHCSDWPKVTHVTPTRRQAMREWWATLGGELNRFELAFKRAAQSAFLSGKNGRWKSEAPCDFDWLLSKSNLAAVLEGKYDNRASPAEQPAGKPKTVLDPYESKPQIQLGGVKRG